MKKQTSSIQVLIEKIKVDQVLLEEKEALIDEAKKSNKEIIVRLKDFYKDIKILKKYATFEENKMIENLDLNDFGRSATPQDRVVVIVIKIMKDKLKLNNGQLFANYLKTLDGQQSNRITYTEFNIKIRSLFKNGMLTRAKSNASSSREDIITYSGK